MKVMQVRESLIESIISDLFTFCMLAGLWYLNHNFFGSSGVIDFFIAFSVIIGVTNKIDTKYSVKSAVEFLQSEEARQYIKEDVETHPTTSQGQNRTAGKPQSAECSTSAS